MIRDTGVPVPLKIDVLIFLKDVLEVPKSISMIERTLNQFLRAP